MAEVMTAKHFELELDWLRNFAATLAASGDDDDLVQDTLIAAWTHAPEVSSDRPLRPWLAKVARNRSRMNVRSRERRRRREREAGDAPGPGQRRDPEAELDRLEVLRAVFEAVEELPELDRRIIVRRFLHDENATQIGAHLDMPAATVRSRLSRALARVRARVDARFGGSRKSWALAVLGPAGSPPPKAAASGLGVKLGVGLATASLAAVGWWSCQREDNSEAASGDERHIAAPEADVDDPPPASERERWQQRRARVRAALAKAPPSPSPAPDSAADEDGPEAPAELDDEERSARARARAGFHRSLDACVDDLDSDANGAITLTAAVIGDPEVGTIFDSIEIVAETVDDPEVLRCVTESMYAYVGEPPAHPVETRYNVTTPWIGGKDSDTRKERRIFEAIVGAHHGEVLVCQREAPEAEGTLTLELTIGPERKPEAPEIVSADLPEAVTACIVERSQLWAFPADLVDKAFRYEFRLPVPDLINGSR